MDTFISNFSKKSQMKFKEAALPIKEIKKRIRAKMAFEGQIEFEKVTAVFEQD